MIFNTFVFEHNGLELFLEIRSEWATVGICIETEEMAEYVRNNPERCGKELAYAYSKVSEAKVIMNLSHFYMNFNGSDCQKITTFIRKHYSSDDILGWCKTTVSSEIADDQDKTEAQEILQRCASEGVKSGCSKQRRREFQRDRSQIALALIERDGYKCQLCDSVEDITIDHIVALSKGGTDDLNNLRFLCRKHNSSKNDK